MIQTQPDRRWFYIQRLKIEQGPEVTPLIRNDYMGSAEFEFGTVPRAWGSLRTLRQLDKLAMNTTTFKTRFGTPIWFIAHKELNLDWLDTQLKRLFSKESIRGKEFSDFHYWMNPDQHRNAYTESVNAWITVDGGVTSNLSGRTDPEASPVFFTVDTLVLENIWYFLTLGK
jgi:hypothetical protein